MIDLLYEMEFDYGDDYAGGYHIEEPWKDSAYIVELLSNLDPVAEGSISYDLNQVKAAITKPSRDLPDLFTYKLEFANPSSESISVSADAETAHRILEQIRDEIGSDDDVNTAQAYLRQMVQKEFDDLLIKQNDEARDDRIDEILDEVVSYDAKFEDFCGFRVETHPKTYRLMQTMTLAGWHVVMHFKRGFNRTRPSFLNPKIIPIIDVPTHPAYPSGHATQSYLVALALTEVFAKRDLVPSVESRSFTDGLKKLAKEIGINREWAGVHYESDSVAGRKLATSLAEIWFNKDHREAHFPKLDRLFEEASDEWYENKPKAV